MEQKSQDNNPNYSSTEGGPPEKFLLNHNNIST